MERSMSGRYKFSTPGFTTSHERSEWLVQLQTPDKRRIVYLILYPEWHETQAAVIPDSAL